MSFEGVRLSFLGETAFVLTVGSDVGFDAHEKVKAVSYLLESAPPNAMVEYVPAFTTVTVIYDPMAATHEEFADRLQRLLENAPEARPAVEARLVEIPVCYGEAFGPDLDFVASHNTITPDEVIAIHADSEYLVYMIGFAPGFPYMGGMSERIAVPRRDSPRQRVPVGSVGIAGKQTGIYSIETPGGWQLIGRTPLRLFRPDEDEPSLLRTGDHVRFHGIDHKQYDELFKGEARA